MSSVSELFCPARLPHKPYCSNNKTASHIRPVDIALGHTHIQFNPPNSYNWMVFDVDFYCKDGFQDNECARSLAYMRAVSHCDNKNAPAPNYIVINPKSGHAHYIYCLKTPIARGENARLRPQRWYKSIYNRLAQLLEADSGFAGVLCRNPLHPDHITYKPCDKQYELADLEEYVKDEVRPVLAQSKLVFDDSQRNITIFDFTRTWAYANINQYGDFESLYAACEDYAESINIFPRVGSLSVNELSCIARSIAKYVWACRHEACEWRAEFSERQAGRGRQKGASKRLECLEAAKRLHAEGMSYREISARLGVSFKTVGNWLARS